MGEYFRSKLDAEAFIRSTYRTYGTSPAFFGEIEHPFSKWLVDYARREYPFPVLNDLSRHVPEILSAGTHEPPPLATPQDALDIAVVNTTPSAFVGSVADDRPPKKRIARRHPDSGASKRISLTCACGKQGSVRAERAGKRVKCRVCYRTIRVPIPDPEVYAPLPPSGKVPSMNLVVLENEVFDHGNKELAMRSIEFIYEQLEKGSPDERKRAANLLCQVPPIGDADAISRLIWRLEAEDDLEVIPSIIMGLRGLEAKTAIPHLRKMLAKSRYEEIKKSIERGIDYLCSST